MKLRDLHPWVVSPAEAAQIQRMLSPQVIRRGEPAEVRLIAGVDISVDTSRRRGIGAVVVLSYPDLQLVEASIEEADLSFPYVPGLLSFRETPVRRASGFSSSWGCRSAGTRRGGQKQWPKSP